MEKISALCNAFFNRLYHYFERGEQWKRFREMSFHEFLYQVGMFKTGKDLNDVAALADARKRYQHSAQHHSEADFS